MMATILIADDEKNIRSGLQIAFEDEGYDVLTAENGEIAWKLINTTSVDLVITDIRMPVMTGLDLLEKSSSAYPLLPIIVLTGHGTIETAVQACKNGAADFFTKPIDLDHLLLTVSKCLANRKVLDENKRLTEELEKVKRESGYKKIIGQSEKVSRMMGVIKQVASTNANVLIQGESGVGKELVADALHNLSLRKDKPFIKVNCASLTPTLLESELFGHEKGAFTGAIARKKGRFELADGGTLFLDEIGEIDLSTQVKLLRVLQERQFERVGGEETLTVDVRVVAATNRNLAEEVKKGNFREDLYFRLNVVHIEVPPLRERKEDIPLLISHFLETLSSKNNRKVDSISAQARKALFAYSWPGNIRELQNAIEAGVVMCHGRTIELEDLPEQIKSIDNEDMLSVKLGSSLEEVEKELITRTISFCGGNKTKAATVLGIGRKTLHRKLLEYNMERDDD
ncbi:MAG: sigma-54-dependent Fis family transcriptional regulator [Spirochaetales bacterium]|nr:sigma-54-dependent Fis family transcriptional regulator [Spirochaetales bacterium]